MYTFIFNINYLQVASVFLVKNNSVFCVLFQQVLFYCQLHCQYFKISVEIFFLFWADLREIPHLVFLKNILLFFLLSWNTHGERCFLQLVRLRSLTLSSCFEVIKQNNPGFSIQTFLLCCCVSDEHIHQNPGWYASATLSCWAFKTQPKALHLFCSAVFSGKERCFSEVLLVVCK